MPIFLTTLLASVRSIFQSRAALELENMALRHPIAVLRRSAAKRLKLTSADPYSQITRPGCCPEPEIMALRMLMINQAREVFC
jgi:hypothetical protein